MMPVTLNFIDKLEKVSFFIFEKAARSIFLHGQAPQVAGFSGASRKAPHMVKDNFFSHLFWKLALFRRDLEICVVKTMHANTLHEMLK